MFRRRDLRSLLKVVASGICCAVSFATAQWNGYISSTQGFNTNPLYNYSEQSDQLNQSYLELGWNTGEGVSRGRIGYIGSLVLFNQISDRSYYEHTIQGEYIHLFPKREWKGEDDLPSIETFSGNALKIQAKIGARHDKEMYKEYDNLGGSATVSYKALVGRWTYIIVANELGYRRYDNVPDLSNLVDIPQVRFGGTLAKGVEGSLFVSGGIKHFTSSTIDTSVVEVAGTGTSTTTGTGTGNGNGKGKGKGITPVSTPGQGSPKKNAIVVNPTSTNAFILGLGGDLGAKWKSGSAAAEAVLRINLSDRARYVAQFANTLGLGEDIYNDFFSYEGPEFKLSVTQSLPLGVSLRLAGEYARRTFLAPAFDLEGVEVADSRLDVRAAGEIVISRGFELSDALSIDVMITGAVVSNNSNDVYNDYSVRGISIGVGFSF
jgi:hypothetical protein